MIRMLYYSTWSLICFLAIYKEWETCHWGWKVLGIVLLISYIICIIGATIIEDNLLKRIATLEKLHKERE